MIFWELFYTFFLIGLFTFGGGYAMLPLIQERVVANGWMSSQQITDFIAVSESTPGPFAINIATYVGTETTGGNVFGAVCATLGVVLPSFLVILLVARIYEKFKRSRIVAGCMTGLRPVVVGLIASAVLGMAADVFLPMMAEMPTLSLWDQIAAAVTTVPFYMSLFIFAWMLVLVFKKVHPVVVILLSAALGIAGGYIDKFWI
ncbi:MAG: chromate transporter [Clostridia bacterium]|nr:chromate transporter [Clostridia bacterium]